jgi:hypothetical protein
MSYLSNYDFVMTSLCNTFESFHNNKNKVPKSVAVLFNEFTREIQESLKNDQDI